MMNKLVMSVMEVLENIPGYGGFLIITQVFVSQPWPRQGWQLQNISNNILEADQEVATVAEWRQLLNIQGAVWKNSPEGLTEENLEGALTLPRITVLLRLSKSWVYWWMKPDE